MIVAIAVAASVRSISGRKSATRAEESDSLEQCADRSERDYGRKRMFRQVLIITAAIAVSLSWNAARADTDDYRKCVNSDATNFDWSQCGAAEINRQEALLNSAWKKAFNCFNGAYMMKAKQDFLDEQRLWIKWKDSSCKFYENGDAFGREGAVLGFPQCRISVIAERTKYLENFEKGCGSQGNSR